jgi:hypothetical protein
VTICATAVQRCFKSGNLKDALLPATRITKRLVTSAFHNVIIYVIVSGAVELLHCGLEVSGTLGWGEGWNDGK